MSQARAVGWPLAHKAAYLVLLLGSLVAWGNLDWGQFHTVNVRWPREGEPVFASHFATWDGAHYLLLSEEGYAEGLPSCAFYPLLPMLIRAAGPLFGGNHVIAGLALSNVFSLAAWTLFYRLVSRRWGRLAAIWSLVFLITFPGSLFFQFIYSESLFLLLLVLLWLGLEERRYGLAAVFAVLLPVSRGVGAFAVLPLAWHAFSVARPTWHQKVCDRAVECWEGGGNATVGSAEQGTGKNVPIAENGARTPSVRVKAAGIRQESQRPSTGVRLEMAGDRQQPIENSGERRGQTWLPWLLVGTPFVGWCVYLALMWHWTENPFEGFEAQKYWRVHSISNLWNAPKFVFGFWSPTGWHAFRGSLLDRCAFLMVLYTLPVMWYHDKGMLVWTYWLAVLPAMSGTFTSFTRFASCAFPVFIALGVELSRREWRWWRYGLLSVFVTLHIVLVWRFVNFRWAG
ncbi:MAG: hypothetical protein H7A45_06795 [Verrucomicrobiales bacterium]|nr:hypothetical protein [Verrucomicrobiales bacterium]